MSLSIEEQDFLNKIEQEKIKHREASKKYRATNKNKIADYNKNYNDNKKAKLNAIKSKIPKLQPTPINIQQIMTKPPKIDKRTRKGKKQKSGDIKPFYEIRKEPLEYSTIEDYLKKADIIQKIFIKKSLSQEVKAEIRKLLNDNKTINEELILNEMTYINNNIEPTINALREHYKNDNSFKSYVNILVVIASHLKTLNKSVYQTLTKLNIYLTQQIQEKRKENKIEVGDESKIIDLDKTTILKNLNKLDNIRDKLIFGLYTLFPARREEWRFTIITTEKNKEKLEDPENNYLIISTKPKRIVFNNYKTDKKYKQQIFNIDDKDLDNIIDTYILKYGLNNGDYLISLVRNKKEIISQPNFSKLVSYIFYKVYNIPISIRFLRMSWTSDLLNKNPSVQQMEILANQMAHGLTEQQKYKKLK
jgi:uncharacterized protein YheU (UPF0270 family)